MANQSHPAQNKWLVHKSLVWPQRRWWWIVDACNACLPGSKDIRQWWRGCLIRARDKVKPGHTHLRPRWPIFSTHRCERREGKPPTDFCVIAIPSFHLGLKGSQMAVNKCEVGVAVPVIVWMYGPNKYLNCGRPLHDDQIWSATDIG